VFVEDKSGRLGRVGDEYFSHVLAQDKADEFGGITHIIEAQNLTSAKRYLKGKLSKRKGDLSPLYKNVSNRERND